MFKSYLKIAARNLLKNRTYTLINIFGLVLGVTCALLIFLFVQDELSYDQYHTKNDRIFRLYTNLERPSGDIDTYASCPAGAGPHLGDDFPEIALTARVTTQHNTFVEFGEQQFYETLTLADSSLMDIFDYTPLFGDPKQALRSPDQIILTASTARKYFGKLNAVDKILTVNDTVRMTVGAVIEDLPGNTHFHFDLLMSTAKDKQNLDNNWWTFGVYMYVLFKDNVDIEAFREKVERYSSQYIAEQENGSNYFHHLDVQKVTDIHLHSDKKYEWESNSKLSYVYIFAVIALFILGMACINYMNLATARSAKRAKEVGLRKVIGSSRLQLMGQFIGESILLALISVGIALVLTELLLPAYNQLIERQLEIDYVSNPWLYIGLLLLAVCIGLAAGSYPAFFLSSFKPVYTLKGNFSGTKSGKYLRQSLVVFQFVITIALMTSTLVVYNQLNFMRDKDLGFDQEQILVLDTRQVSSVVQKATVLKEELLKSSDIQLVSFSSGVPGNGGTTGVVFKANEKEGEGDVWTDLRIIAADEDFAAIYGLDLEDGRNFDVASGVDRQGAFLLNESAIEELDLDKATVTSEKLGFTQGQRMPIRGVVKDFHFKSLQTQIEPMVIYFDSEYHNPYRASKRFLSVQFNAQRTREVLDFMNSTWKSVVPNRPIEYVFLDQDFAKHYRQDVQISHLFQIFAGIAIFIACLGLLGLSAYMAEQRTKEIGIRKVLGASITHILGLMSGQFMRLVVVAALIAFPLSYFLMNYWLQDFAYRITINVFLFPLIGLLALGIALLTVSFHALRVAGVNPSRVLKDE